MNDDQLTPAPAPDPVGGKPDWVLQNLTHLTNRLASMRTDLTVVVSGGLLTGTLVSSAAYWTVLRELAKPSNNVLVHFYDVYAGLATDMNLQSDDPEDVGFLHLLDASMVTGTGPLPSDGLGYFRVNLTSVSAWSVGRLGPLPENSMVETFRQVIESLPSAPSEDEESA